MLRDFAFERVDARTYFADLAFTRDHADLRTGAALHAHEAVTDPLAQWRDLRLVRVERRHARLRLSDRFAGEYASEERARCGRSLHARGQRAGRRVHADTTLA